MSKIKYAVISAVSEENIQQAALVGITVTQDLKIIFAHLKSSRKYKILSKNPAIAILIGWDSEIMIHYEGIAKFRMKLTERGSKFPDGIDRKDQCEEISYFYVELAWIRYSDYCTPQNIEEVYPKDW